LISTPSIYSYGKLKIVTEVAAWNAVTAFENNKFSPIVVVTSEIGSSQQVNYPVKSANMDLEEFVQEAAVAEFNNPNGRFTTAEFSIDAFSINGTLLANSFRPGLVGTDRTNYQDLNDVYAIQMFVNRAKQGGGYVINVYQNPATGNEEVKLNYVLPIDETWFITSGKYQPEYDAYVSPDKRAEMIQYVREIEALMQEKGKEETADLLNNGTLFREDMRMRIFDYNGTYVVGYPYTQELVGTSSLGVTDIYGASIGREVLTMAQSGGGFRYMYYPYLSGETKLTLTYVEPIDDEWYAMISLPLTMIGSAS
jgi:signal transduction histidine kinase